MNGYLFFIIVSDCLCFCENIGVKDSENGIDVCYCDWLIVWMSDVDCIVYVLLLFFEVIICNGCICMIIYGWWVGVFKIDYLDFRCVVFCLVFCGLFLLKVVIVFWNVFVG